MKDEPPTSENAEGDKPQLHLVFGGHVSDPQSLDFDDFKSMHVVGIYPNYAEAEEAWRAWAQRTVDDAGMKYVVVHLHRLLQPELVNRTAATD